MTYVTSPTRTASGFTLIEMIVVILILGVLAAVALPKFVNLKSEARAATIVSATGSIRSAVALVHGKVLTSGTATDATLRQVDIGGGSMIEVKYGYPACTADGIAKASGTGPNSANYVWNMGGSDLCTLYPNLGKDSAGNTIYSNECAVVYDSSAGITWTPVTSGC